jgi:hypothetical protein
VAGTVVAVMAVGATVEVDMEAVTAAEVFTVVVMEVAVFTVADMGVEASMAAGTVGAAFTVEAMPAEDFMAAVVITVAVCHRVDAA